MSGSAIVLERETANDESATLVKIYVVSGTPVAADELIFDIENSKATQELRAPHAGVLEHQLKLGETVEFGVAIAALYSAEEWANRQSGAHGAEQEGSKGIEAKPTSPPTAASRSKEVQIRTAGALTRSHFSRAAADLIAEHSLDTSEFSAEFIVADDVRKRLGLIQPVGRPPATSPTPRPANHATEGQAVVGRKRAEIETLSGGAGGTMLSVLGVKIGAISIPRNALDFLDGRITDIVIYESSRLLRKFPNLNSYFAEGRIYHHQSLHAGLAIDGGGRLVVYGIENADKASLQEVSNTIADAVARYAKNELSASELSRATFTVTDLSDANLDFVFPLLPKGQGCILGITRSEDDGFRIFAGFDHRVTEGREVAQFLSELRERLSSFGSPDEGVKKLVRCAYCDRSTADAVSKNSDRGLLKIADRQGLEAYCCASCWNGW